MVRYGIRLRWIASRVQGSGVKPKNERDGNDLGLTPRIRCFRAMCRTQFLCDGLRRSAGM